MVNDILQNSQNEISKFTNTILEAQNMEFRQTAQTLRNTLESFQFELFRLATSKGYYQPSSQAKPEEINSIKSNITTI